MTTTAISMMRSRSGDRPVISRSIQTRFWSLERQRGHRSSAFAFSVAGIVRSPTLAAMRCKLALTVAVRRRAARVAGAQALAGDAPDAPRGGAPRRRAGRLRRHRAARRPTSGRPTTRWPRAASACVDHGLRHRRAARLDAARRAGRAERRGARRRAAALRRHGLPARAAGRLRARSAGCSTCRSSWYRTFRIEQRFGFNRMTPKLFVVDSLKGAAASAPCSACRWRRWCCGSWAPPAPGGGCGPGARGPAFNLLMLVLYPTVIAPLFNKFEPLPDDDAGQRACRR